MAGRILDKTVESFTEATGCLEDTLKWVAKARDYAHEFDPTCKAYVDLVLVEKVLEKSKTTIDKASKNLCEEIFTT
jgi:hypothetical protein